MNTIADIQTLYARLGERDYEAVMSYLADDIAWIVADNSPLADRSPYRGIAEVRSGVFERLTAGFDKLVFDDSRRPGRQVPAIPRHAPGRTRRGSGLTLQALLPFGNSLVFWWAALTNVRTHARSDEGLTCGEIRTFASNGWVAYLFDS
ncbi:MAG: hypothetical protein DMF12_07360 [Verrucomicrobia bacterium]|nr:MAG: hypothetical protein DMF12_07360 [Verrucomicrobiota bacterium]